mmetsp:Transcript_17535/g.38100  ORF Transcript_17535/g.38100 Transcript_17535/m.38100 type:complete len:146 (+) Transcript_17535:178-615(+)|eukprot:CAMPEP_0178647450 /NCGR_PEP_ID=MMETSP0698-20121128/19932_1 /TAXON_ID=265572 /ORGANISM="Extubocellulus spinifer, Strain CCMP396" /LENGTH=145 /DNA_ID=CAMNT_0020288709 /DNA_START=87 /DNA_END=524 /DNA_ORIENTATION=+
MKLSNSLPLLVGVALLGSSASSPFDKRNGTRSFFGIRPRGGATTSTSTEPNDMNANNYARIALEASPEPVVDLVVRQRVSRPMTVPKIGVAAAALYGVADVGSRIIVNTSGATAPVVMAAGAAASLMTGVWAGGKRDVEVRSGRE